MFAGSQNTQFALANQLKRERSTITIKDVSTVLQLAAVVLVTLFLAGIAAPSFLRSEAAGSHALASGSLHTLTVARIPFTYTFWNLASAVLGALFGAAAVLVMSSPASPGSIARIGRAIWRQPKRTGQVHRAGRSGIHDRRRAPGWIPVWNRIRRRVCADRPTAAPPFHGR